MTDSRLTATQQVALRYYASGAGLADTREGRPAVSTRRALSRRGLIQDRQATDAEKEAIGRPTDQPWRITELTADGRRLAGVSA